MGWCPIGLALTILCRTKVFTILHFWKQKFKNFMHKNIRGKMFFLFTSYLSTSVNRFKWFTLSTLCLGYMNSGYEKVKIFYCYRITYLLHNTPLLTYMINTHGILFPFLKYVFLPLNLTQRIHIIFYLLLPVFEP